MLIVDVSREAKDIEKPHSPMEEGSLGIGLCCCLKHLVLSDLEEVSGKH